MAETTFTTGGVQTVRGYDDVPVGAVAFVEGTTPVVVTADTPLPVTTLVRRFSSAESTVSSGQTLDDSTTYSTGDQIGVLNATTGGTNPFALVAQEALRIHRIEVLPSLTGMMEDDVDVLLWNSSDAWGGLNSTDNQPVDIDLSAAREAVRIPCTWDPVLRAAIADPVDVVVMSDGGTPETPGTSPLHTLLVWQGASGWAFPGVSPGPPGTIVTRVFFERAGIYLAGDA